MAELFKVRAIEPLASHVDGFCAVLVGLGYAPRTVRDYGYVLVVERFLRARRRAGYCRWCSVRSVRPLLDYPREVAKVSVWRPPAAEGSANRILDVYRRFPRVERHLALTTLRIHEDIARRFLSRYADDDRLDLEGLASADVTMFVLA